MPNKIVEIFGSPHAVILSLSHGFKMSLRNSGFSGVFGSFSETNIICVICVNICVIDRKYWYIYQIKPKKMENRKEKMSQLPMKNVPSANLQIVVNEQMGHFSMVSETFFLHFLV